MAQAFNNKNRLKAAQKTVVLRRNAGCCSMVGSLGGVMARPCCINRGTDEIQSQTDAG